MKFQFIGTFPPLFYNMTRLKFSITGSGQKVWNLPMMLQRARMRAQLKAIAEKNETSASSHSITLRPFKKPDTIKGPQGPVPACLSLPPSACLTLTPFPSGLAPGSKCSSGLQTSGTSLGHTLLQPLSPPFYCILWTQPGFVWPDG